MVNENQGKVYKPVPVYDRKLVRDVIRNSFAKKYGFHKVNKNLSSNFHRIREGMVK